MEKFKDPNSGKYGLKNILTNEIVVQPRYSNITFFNDSIFIDDDNLKGDALFDINENLLIDYSNTFLMFNQMTNENCPYDTINNNRLMEAPFTDPRGNMNMHAYYINKYGQCLPSDYFPCPAWKETKIDDKTPNYLKIIQKGEDFRWQNQIDSAIIYCQKAIDLIPENPYVYYWGAKLLIKNYQENINSKNNLQYSDYFEWINDCLTKADSLENRYWYKLQILRLKKDFYKNSINNKQQYKKAKKDIKELKNRCL